MMDPRMRGLQALIRLRKTEVDEAKSALAKAMAEENAAVAYRDRQHALIESEQREATAGRTSMDDFRQWLPAGRAAVERAERAILPLRQASDQARGALMQANAALKAAQAIVDKRLEEEKEIRERREQAEIDDLSRRNTPAST
ncbi:MAG: flagellar FliJ family protein [Komagataeibacter hansenii]|nr:flagellar FliJ family protein [Novacetimonas hansenii]